MIKSLVVFILSPGLDGGASKMWCWIRWRGQIWTGVWVLCGSEAGSGCHGVCDGELQEAQRGLKGRQLKIDKWNSEQQISYGLAVL